MRKTIIHSPNGSFEVSSDLDDSIRLSDKAFQEMVTELQQGINTGEIELDLPAKLPKEKLSVGPNQPKNML